MLSVENIWRRAGRFFITACGLPLALAAGNGSALQLYRYLDNNGKVVINQHIPIDMVERGYDVISDNGKLIRRIAPQKSAEELALTETARAEEAATQEEIRQRQIYDTQLLLRYASTEDIAIARERSLKEFEQRLLILQNSLIDLKRQVENLQSKAANYERKSENVPELLAKSLSDALLEIESIQLRQATATSEKAKAADTYEKDRVRFDEIKATSMAR